MNIVSQIISTHDLTKRSTRQVRFNAYYQRYFNSRPHEEVDCIWLGNGSTIRYFNSRPHEEVDGKYMLFFYDLDKISTHDLTKRSTNPAIRGYRNFIISTHDLTKRSTAAHQMQCLRKGISTHDLTKRSTQKPSIHTPET